MRHAPMPLCNEQIERGPSVSNPPRMYEPQTRRQGAGRGADDEQVRGYVQASEAPKAAASHADIHPDTGRMGKWKRFT